MNIFLFHIGVIGGSIGLAFTILKLRSWLTIRQLELTLSLSAKARFQCDDTW